MPFLSWTPVFIGDPLMRLAYNRNSTALVNPEPLPGDCNRDGAVDFTDLTILAEAYATALGDPGYNHRGDVDTSLAVGFDDLLLLLENYGDRLPDDFDIIDPDN
jgi:hypothetical protein